jgi:glycosyltransferase involved in cell wall biosynthesis
MSITIRPEVSVLVVTYNHEKYIRQALDSVVTQKTDFDFEIVVADDYSQDSTLKLLKEYQAERPEVRILPTEQKLGITRNYRRGFDACRGEYVAILEGDDFWISPSKLNILSAFLRQNEECSFCFHRTIRLDEASGRVAVYPQFDAGTEFGPFTPNQLARGNFIGGLSTCMYRREVIANLGQGLWNLKVREWPFNIVVAQQGLIGYVPEIMSIYRVHPSGIWSMKTAAEHRAVLLECIETYNEYLGFKFDAEFKAYRRRLLGSLEQSAAVRESTVAELPPLYRRFGRRIKPWLKPFLPPVFVTLARNIYVRAGGSRHNPLT